MIQALIFDLDGTLADTLDAIAEAVNMTMTHFGYPTRSREQVRAAIGNGARKLVERSLPQDVAGQSERVSEAFAYYDSAYEKTYLHTDHCYDGMVEAIEELHRRGYIIAVLSNKQDVYVKGLCEALFEKGMIAWAQGQTELPRKPDPTAALMIAKQLGVEPSRCAFIGDSEVDMYTAQNAGMLSVGCAWGFRGEAVLLESGADLIAHEPSALTDIFCGTTA